MNDVEVIQVVRTRLTRKGDGKTDPIRHITQYWSLDGELLAEVDPLADDAPVWEGKSLADLTAGGMGAVARAFPPVSRPHP